MVWRADVSLAELVSEKALIFDCRNTVHAAVRGWSVVPGFAGKSCPTTPPEDRSQNAYSRMLAIVMHTVEILATTRLYIERCCIETNILSLLLIAMHPLAVIRII